MEPAEAPRPGGGPLGAAAGIAPVGSAAAAPRIGHGEPAPDRGSCPRVAAVSKAATLFCSSVTCTQWQMPFPPVRAFIVVRLGSALDAGVPCAGAGASARGLVAGTAPPVPQVAHVCVKSFAPCV